MAQAWIKKFDRELDKKIKDLFGPKGVVLEFYRLSVRFTYEQVFIRWPVDTAWSLANHRIATDTKNVTLTPTERPKEKGVLLARATQVKAEEIAKLKKITLKTTITIGNAVPYAADVGRGQTGVGTAIYLEAGVLGPRKAEFQLKVRGKLPQT